MQPFDLTGKRALVTGGNGGIGLGIAKALAKAGASVVIVGRTQSKIDNALAQLHAMGAQAEGEVFDFANVSAIAQWYDDLCRKNGDFDVLFNNAGIQHRGRITEIELEDFERVMRVNVTAPYILSRSFARRLIAAGKPGSIVFTASLMSEASRYGTSPYTASKGAIRQLIKALAVDLAESGIRVNGVGPGYIATEMTEPLRQKPDFDAWVKKRTPLGRWGTPEDFAGAAVYLASDASAFVTGQILYVDGGWLATF